MLLVFRRGPVHAILPVGGGFGGSPAAMEATQANQWPSLLQKT
jgi:hypothetical protein